MTQNFAKIYTLQELESLTGSKLVGNPQHKISGVDSLETATSCDASFLANLRYKERMHHSEAGVVFVSPSIELDTKKNYLVSEDPSKAFQKAIELFLHCPSSVTGFTGIHPTAVIHPSVQMGTDVNIGPYVTIDQGSEIGDHTQIMAHCSIGPGVKMGSHCKLYPHVTVREKCILGSRVVLQPGVVIGSCGFGLSTSPEGIHTRLDQLGIVELEDDVEIGANTTVDRARLKVTKICRGTKVDNLVQVGHNVELGPHNIVVAQTGISGSAKTGRNVVLGGQAGIVGHLEIPAGTFISARGGVSKTLAKPGKYAGTPVLPLAEHNKQQVHLRKISTYVKKLEALEQRLNQLEESSSTV